MAGPTPQYSAFPNSPAGKRLLYLFIPSPALSLLAMFLGKPMGITSLFLIPSALLFTSIHSAVIRWLLARKPRTTTDVDSPGEARFECLHHWANICIEGFTAALWLAGGAISIITNVLKWKPKSSPQDVAAASLAIIEGIIVLAITVYCWKLRKEAQVCRMVKMTSSITIVDPEGVALMDQAKTNV